MPNVTLGGYNTVAIAAASGVYRLSFNGGSSRSIDLMNLGDLGQEEDQRVEFRSIESD